MDKLTFKQLLENQRKAAAKQQEAEKEDKRLLFGTGANKKTIAKGIKDYAREEKQAFTDQASREKANAAFADMQNDLHAAAQEMNTRRGEIEFDESQLAALEGLVKERFGILIGPAGSGKTTVELELVRRLVAQVGLMDLYETRMETVVLGEEGNPDNPLTTVRRPMSENPDRKPKMVPAVAFAAYTGIAMQQMKKSVGDEYADNCSTIHSLLNYAPEDEDFWDEEIQEYRTRRVFRPQHTKYNKLPHKLFIFDEASMIPIGLWNEFIEACQDDVRIILIGDLNQLPPPMGKGVLGYAMTRWPVFELKKIHRQAADNPIIANAHNVLNGRYPIAYKGFFNIVDSKAKVPNGEYDAANYFLNVIKHLHQRGDFDPIKHNIIVPYNKGGLGQVELNERLMTYFNPERKVDGMVLNKRINIHTGTGHALYAVGDKVMILQNDHTIGVTNGMTGVITDINLNGKYDDKRSQINTGEMLDFDLGEGGFDLDALIDDDEADQKKEKETKDQRQSSHVTTVEFANGVEVKFSTAGEYGKLTLAYVTTCHKAQGSEYETVIILCHAVNSRMLCREWLYTAITRARKRVILVCNDRGLMLARNNQKIKGRDLDAKIANYISENVMDFHPDEIEDEAKLASFNKDRHPIIWRAEKYTGDND